MIFEYDEVKNQANIKKHGISFIEAQNIWLDKDCIEFALPYEDEPRFVAIGQYRCKVWAAIITYREERIRIISVRRARKNEVRLYEDNKK